MGACDPVETLDDDPHLVQCGHGVPLYMPSCQPTLQHRLMLQAIAHADFIVMLIAAAA